MSTDVLDIQNRAKSRRAAKAQEQVEAQWHCHYCDKRFTHEMTFMNHVCKERLRYEELRSPIGQAAYAYYCEWMKQYKRKAPPIDTFGTSRYYTAFVKFAKYVNDVSLPAPNTFIRLMSDRDISPTLWARAQCYSIYLEFYDKSVDPLDQVQLSIMTLLDICEKENVEMPDVFNHLQVPRINELLRLRKLSPWLIFCSQTFGQFLKTLSPDDWSEMSKIVNPSHWSEKLAQNKKIVADIILISKELDL